MKTKEEIEQLAEQYLQKNKHNFDTWKEIEHTKISYINAYTQCQEDVDEKKYTEADMLKLWNTLMVAMTSKNPIFFSDYIKSLNK
jgi:hypothetical protein